MIQRLEAYHYRCFDHLDIRLSHYQVLAGANGSGKSTLLDIPLLFQDFLTRGVAEAFQGARREGQSPRCQDFRELIYCQRGNYFGFALELDLPSDLKEELLGQAPKSVTEKPDHFPNALRYEIRFELFNHDLQARDEFLHLVPVVSSEPEGGWGIGGKRPKSWRLLIDRTGGAPTKIHSGYKRSSFELNLSPVGLALANVPRDRQKFPASVWLRETLERGVMRYQPNIEALHRPYPRLEKELRADGANLPWLALELRRDDPDLFAAWEEHVKMALPSLEGIEAVQREGDAYAFLKLHYRGGHSVTSSGLSYGTLQILAVTILPYLRRLPSLIFLEEPENGIHPRAIEVLLQSLSSVYDSQIWVSTHSPVVLAHTDLEAVVVLQSSGSEGSRAILGADHPRLQDWQGAIDLGSLFAAGVLS
ncbi:MAG: AAA family ATPase [Cyanobacteriota bacterium]|nr:AAA family ATPase [Cyanobacteriota bacterium]